MLNLHIRVYHFLLECESSFKYMILLKILSLSLFWHLTISIYSHSHGSVEFLDKSFRLWIWRFGQVYCTCVHSEVKTKGTAMAWKVVLMEPKKAKPNSTSTCQGSAHSTCIILLAKQVTWPSLISKGRATQAAQQNVGSCAAIGWVYSCNSILWKWKIETIFAINYNMIIPLKFSLFSPFCYHCHGLSLLISPHNSV